MRAQLAHQLQILKAADANDAGAIKRRRKKEAKSARGRATNQVEPQGLLGKFLVQCKSNTILNLFHPFRTVQSLTLLIPSVAFALNLLRYSLGRILLGRHSLLRQPPRRCILIGPHQPTQLWSRPILRTHDFRR